MKHIIVSGCAHGIGEAVARKFLQEGYFNIDMPLRSINLVAITSFIGSWR